MSILVTNSGPITSVVRGYRSDRKIELVTGPRSTSRVCDSNQILVGPITIKDNADVGSVSVLTFGQPVIALRGNLTNLPRGTGRCFVLTSSSRAFYRLALRKVKVSCLRDGHFRRVRSLFKVKTVRRFISSLGGLLGRRASSRKWDCSTAKIRSVGSVFPSPRFLFLETDLSGREGY